MGTGLVATMANCRKGGAKASTAFALPILGKEKYSKDLPAGTGGLRPFILFFPPGSGKRLPPAGGSGRTVETKVVVRKMR